MSYRHQYCCLVLFLLFGVVCIAEGQTKRALLIGINTYQPAGTSAKHPSGCTYGRCDRDLTSFDNLSGAVNDVKAFRDLLSNPKFGFAPKNIVTICNPDLPPSTPPYTNLPSTETTRDKILAAMKKYLVDEPHKGDVVVFYYSGHGSLRVNSKGTKLSLMVDGAVTHADSTIVPSDAWLGGFDIRDREMNRIFNAALDKGIILTAIFDSCHSGAVARAITPNARRWRERWVPYDPRDIMEGPDLLPDGQPRPGPTERIDNPALVFSAVQQDETAKELPPPDGIPEPQGVFTTALLRALQVLPANVPAPVVYQRVRAYIESWGIPEQTSSLDAGATRRDQPLFGGIADTSKRVLATCLGTDLVGNVLLDSGKLTGVGIGSEFTSTFDNSNGKKIKLRITQFDGITRSKATVVSPDGASVAVGDLFELTKWFSEPPDLLHVWTWPANLSETQLQIATGQIQSSGIAYVDDPVEKPWTDMLSWDGDNWVVQHAGSTSSTKIGPNMTAQILKQSVTSDAQLWVNFPPSREIFSGLHLKDPQSAVQGVSDPSNAEYILAGSLSPKGRSFTWVSKAALQQAPRRKIDTMHSPGCSSSSQYPTRSEWVVADATESARKLNLFASRLAKLKGWLNLASSPNGSSDYYNLAMMRGSDKSDLIDREAIQEGDHLIMQLRSSVSVTQRRWVYILDIDCQGQGKLLYPIEFSENQFPNAADDSRKTDLRGARSIKIEPPYGLDTIIFISTSTPLTNPYDLEFEGVAKGLRASSTPLERLLSATSGGKRALRSEVPTDWGISVDSLLTKPRIAP